MDFALTVSGRYFRHVIFWLHMQDNIINIPLIVQVCYILAVGESCFAATSCKGWLHSDDVHPAETPRGRGNQEFLHRIHLCMWCCSVLTLPQDVLHNRFTAKQRRLRSNAVKPTDTARRPANSHEHHKPMFVHSWPHASRLTPHASRLTPHASRLTLTIC